MMIYPHSARAVRTIVVLSLALFAAQPARAVEELPMPANHYLELCRKSGGSVIFSTNNGFGVAQCFWGGHGRTDCKVSANEVNSCDIDCQSNLCLKANPDRYNPNWPINGGPDSPPPSSTVPTGGSAAPAN